MLPLTHTASNVADRSARAAGVPIALRAGIGVPVAADADLRLLRAVETALTEKGDRSRSGSGVALATANSAVTESGIGGGLLYMLAR